MMHGYYKEPEETAAALDADGWLHTGDLAYRDEDGYFFVVGRSKELIIKGGVNIAPRQIDDVLESHPAVLEAAAIGVPDRYVGEDLMAFVVLRAGRTLEENELLSFCEARLGHFKTPTRIHFVHDLPKGPSGKVQRLKLRDDLASLLSSSAESAAPPTKMPTTPAASLPTAGWVERNISATWSEILACSVPNSASNFFALGGHSLLAIQCISLLREKIPVALSLSDFFENATVAQQTALVLDRLRLADVNPAEKTSPEPGTRAAGPSSLSLRNRDLPCPLSPAQLSLWFEQQLQPGSPHYNEAEGMRLLGRLDEEALDRALEVIVSRHEVLRTIIKDGSRQPVAVVDGNWKLQVKQINLSGLSQDAREAEVQRLLIEEPRRLYHLESEPSFRVTLIRVGPQEHVFLLLVHHLFFDWGSLGIFWRELASLYRAFARGEKPNLSSLPVQFGDYAAWKTHEINEANCEEDLLYWDEALRGAPELLALPSDRPRPAVMSHHGARIRLHLDAALASACRDLGRRAQTTLFTVFSAMLSALLYRYTGSDDILLGIPIADRDRKELQDLIGFMLQVHALRTRISPEMTFLDLLAHVQKKSLDLYEHRAAPFDLVVKRLRPNRSPSHSPLYQVMFVWRDRDQMPAFIGLDGMKVESLLAESRSSKFDLTLFATDCGDEIWLEMEYSTDLFDEQRIVRMLGHFRTLLEAVVANPALRIDDAPVLPPGERERLLRDWNRTDAPLPKMLLPESIARQCLKSGSAVAASIEGKSLTYGELDEKSTQLARHLRGLGVQRGVLAAVCMDRSVEMLVAMLAVWKAGGAYVPVDPSFPTKRIALMFDDSETLAVITQKHLSKTIPAGAAHVVSIDADWPAIAASRAELGEAASAEDAAYVIYTSGSTGEPKGVVIPHRAVANFMQSMAHRPGMSSDDVIVAVTTLSFDIAALELFLPLTAGARVEIASRETATDPVRLASLIAQSNATVMQATPATWRMLINSGWKGSPQLKALCGGEALPRDLADRLLSRCAELWNMYGPTETTIWSAIDKVDAGGPILIGRPIDNTRIHILGANLEPVPSGITGELWIAGDGLATGYLHRPELTGERFVKDPFSASPGARIYRTGDLARYCEDGRIECLGRVDNQVKIRGFRIELGEIETTFKRHVNVKECVVVAVQNQQGKPDDKRLTAFIRPTDSGNAPQAKDLQVFLRQTLPDYMIPAAIALVDEFPLTPNGKIDRQALANSWKMSAQSEEGRLFEAPANTRELLLSKVWQRLLAVATIDVNDNFFDLGGHSLLAVRMIGEVNNTFAVNLTLPTFFLNPTVRGLAGALSQEAQSKPAQKLITLRPSTAPGAIFFIEPFMRECRIAQLLELGPSALATTVPFSPEVIQAAIRNDVANLPALERMAAPHAALIRSHQGSLPRVIVGYSFGGILAFEVAHQLQRDGIRVDGLVLVDAFANRSRLHRLKHLTWARVQWALNWRAQSLQSKITGAGERIFSHSKRRTEETTPISEAGSEQISQVFATIPWEILMKILHNAFRKYKCEPLQTRAVMIRAEGARRYNHFADMGWEGLFSGGLNIVDTPGDHLSMFEYPNAPILAQLMSDFLIGLYPQAPKPLD